MQQKDEFCFHIQSLSLRLSVGKLSPLILRDDNVLWLLVPVIFVFVIVGGIVCVSHFKDMSCGIIYCLCFC